ncbi:MAG TPA: hypothetical protein VK154_13855 [Chitinophagales bacterium]|nr:hypothetical protein [Chitinophagales bacterium]
MKNVWIAFGLALCFILGSSFASHKGDSMEKLMKKMLTYIEKEKKQIEQNKPALAFPVAIKQLSTAKAPAKKLVTGHQEFINTFYDDLNKYYQVKDSTQRVAAFNTVVNSCIGCHQHECPGPIVRIKKSLF